MSSHPQQPELIVETTTENVPASMVMDAEPTKVRDIFHLLKLILILASKISQKRVHEWYMGNDAEIYKRAWSLPKKNA